jgi:hypothetical protein
MLKSFLLVLIVISSAHTAAAKEWQGLTPLRSTRLDVERLLGQPAPPPKDADRSFIRGRSTYSLDEGEVHIVFVEEEATGPRPCLVNVPPGTVLMIEIAPKAKLLTSDLKIDGKNFRKFDPAPPDSGYEAYLNEEDGFIVRAFKGEIDLLIYVASSMDRPLCSGYYESLESFVQVVGCNLTLSRNFDEYGDVPFSEEAAHLDNFAIELQSDAVSLGYVVIYGGRRALFAEAQTRGSRAKEYLVKVRGLKANRVIALDGGYRDSFTVQLFIAPPGAAAPLPMPTLSASEVEIIKEKKPRR